MTTTFLKIACTDTNHSDLYVKADDIIIVDRVNATSSVIAMKGGGLVTLTHTSVTAGNNDIAIGVYSALDKALQKAKSKGSSFVETVTFTNSATVESAAFS